MMVPLNFNKTNKNIYQPKGIGKEPKALYLRQLQDKGFRVYHNNQEEYQLNFKLKFIFMVKLVESLNSY